MGKKKTVSNWVIMSIAGLSILGLSPSLIEATPSGSNYSEQVNTLKIKEAKAEDELDSIVSTIEDTEEEAERLVEIMKETSESLDRMQEEISLLTEQIDQRESKLKTQVRAVQVSGQSHSVLSFLLEADSLTDVLGRLDVVHTLFSANQDLMTKQIEDQAKVEENKQNTVKKQEEQAILAAELETKKIELEEKQLDQEILVASIAAEKSEIQEERAAFIAQQHESERRREEIQTARTIARSTTTISVTSSSESNEVSTSSSQTEGTSPAPASSSIVGAAHSLTGVRYSYGGSSSSGFDCSGYTQYAFRQTGKSIPRTAAAQFGASQRLSHADAKPGDLIFFNQSGSIDHVGIYLGGGKFIGAQTSTGVAVASFTSGYWSRYVAGFGRP